MKSLNSLFLQGVWYSYSLLYLEKVQTIPNGQAGALMMLGQIVDTIATIVVGFLSDRYGTKQKWHLLGFFLVFISFAPIYSMCPFCDGNSSWKLIYYTIAIFIFQCAWPIVQISHLAMIPELGASKKDRADLTALRYSAIIVSVVSVFGVMWAGLGSDSEEDNNLSPDDMIKFRVS
jgi:Na+/melibiose symporter-like transporter